MRKISLITATVLLFVIKMFGQNKGINFEANLTWDQILAKARSEQKYVFVDFYASWCVPCKNMERNVYPEPTVGDYFNRNFVSVKMQILDKTRMDTGMMKELHAVGDSLAKEYRIEALPTFLFFNFGGQLVHRAAGGFTPESFVSLATEAVNPQKQYYTLLAEYDKGKRDTSTMKQLSRTAALFGDKARAREIAFEYLKMLSLQEIMTRDNIRLIKYEIGDENKANELGISYIQNLSKQEFENKENIVFIMEVIKDQQIIREVQKQYISQKKIKELLNPENIMLITNMVIDVEDEGFKFLFEHQLQVDSVMKLNHYSQGLFDLIVAQKMIDPELNKSLNTNVPVNWKKLFNSILIKCNLVTAERTILLAKARWYSFKKNSKEFTKSKMTFLKKYSREMSNFEINNEIGWPIFLSSNDKEALLYATEQMEKVVTNEPTFLAAIDTYANLLHKLGRTKEAIKWQEIAVQKDPDHKSFQITLEKMKQGIPTWPTLN